MFVSSFPLTSCEPFRLLVILWCDLCLFLESYTVEQAVCKCQTLGSSIEKDNNGGETYYEKRRFTVTLVVKGVFTPEWFHLYLMVLPSVALLV